MKPYTKIISLQLFAALFILLSFSCSRKESKESIEQKDNNTMLDIIERYYKMQNTKTEGSFIFESNLTNNDPRMTKTVLKGGFFNDPTGKFETDGGDVSIAGQVLTNKNGWYGFDKVESQSGLYGTNVTFSLNPPKSQGGSGPSNQKQTQSLGSQSVAAPLTTTLYSPKPITITNVPPKSTINLAVNASTTLTWNADPLDSNGVVIIASYIPTRIFNYYSYQQGYTHSINSSELVPDNGSTTIPWSFFSSLPAGSHVTLWVARGNYTILANKDYSYKVGGYTAAAVWDVVIPYPTVSGTFTASTGWTSTPYTSISSTGPAVNFNIVAYTSNSVNWASQFQIGTVSGYCVPKTNTSFQITQTSGYSAVWNVTINTSGAVYLNLVSGSPPSSGTKTVYLLNGSYYAY